MKELSEAEALCKAEAYCVTSEHCVFEVSEKLKQWGVESDTRRRILKRLTDEKYIDEARFSGFFVNDKFRYNKWGRTKIAQALWQKRIPQDVYNPYLDGIDEEEYLNVLRGLLSVRKKSIKAHNEYELNGKLIRFALGRGFEMNVIQRCIKLPDDTESLDF